MGPEISDTRGLEISNKEESPDQRGKGQKKANGGAEGRIGQ